MCGCLPALRRGLPAIVAGLRLAISAVVVLSLNVLGKLISLPAPASRFAFPGEPLFVVRWQFWRGFGKSMTR